MKTHIIRETELSQTQIVTDCVCIDTQSHTHVFWTLGFPLPSPQKWGIDSHSAPQPSPLHAHSAGLDSTTQGFLGYMDVWQLDSAMPLGHPTVMTVEHRHDPWTRPPHHAGYKEKKMSHNLRPQSLVVREKTTIIGAKNKAGELVFSWKLATVLKKG